MHSKSLADTHWVTRSFFVQDRNQNKRLNTHPPFPGTVCTQPLNPHQTWTKLWNFMLVSLEEIWVTLAFFLLNYIRIILKIFQVLTLVTNFNRRVQHTIFSTFIGTYLHRNPRTTFIFLETNYVFFSACWDMHWCGWEKDMTNIWDL